MRAFLAIPIPTDVQARLAAEAAGFPKLRPVAAEQLHLTLRFLGDVPRRTLRSLMDELEPVAAAQDPFPIALEGLGCFPDRKKAVVLWVGIGDGELKAGALVQAIEDALHRIGFEREARAWRGHVTLGRFKKPTRVAEQLLLPNAQFGTFSAQEVMLMTSELRPDGPIHSPMHRMSLGKSST